MYSRLFFTLMLLVLVSPQDHDFYDYSDDPYDDYPKSTEPRIECYHCQANGRTCEEFQHSRLWTSFINLCAPNKYCVKIVNRDETFRGCIEKTNVYGRQLALGCSTQPGEGTMCLCEENLCNPSARPFLDLSLFVALIVIVIYFMLN